MKTIGLLLLVALACSFLAGCNNNQQVNEDQLWEAIQEVQQEDAMDDPEVEAGN